MSKIIALELYSVRDAIAKDYAGTIRQVAEMGYHAVEVAGFPGTTAQRAAQVLNDYGMTVVSAHARLPLDGTHGPVLEGLAAVGVKTVFCPVSNRDEVASDDQVKRQCDALNQMGALVRQAGMNFGFHNHWWEYGKTAEGHYVYQILKQELDPATLFQLDLYWIKTAGLDPVEVIKEFGARAPSLHFKDGPALKDQPMSALGAGVMDLPAILKAAEATGSVYIVELDRVANDLFGAVRDSYTYLAKHLK